MSKHTEGPWQINTDKNYCDGRPTIIWGPLGPGYGAVAYTFLNGLILPEAQREEVEANSRLIVVAPELLTVCREPLPGIVGTTFAADLRLIARTLLNDTPYESMAKALQEKADLIEQVVAKTEDTIHPDNGVE